MTATSTSGDAVSMLRTAWRRLRTMRTAIVLLLLLAAGASVGSLFPQRPIDGLAVQRWIDRNPRWTGIAEMLGLFDVYGAWWFMGIYALLLVSLVGCIGPRLRAYWRALRARPRAALLVGQPHYRSGTVAMPPEAALSGAERVLRSRRFRLAREGETLAAEKGYLREAGSLLFHVAFLVILFGMAIGKWFGFSGQTAVVEGERFTETSIDYDFIDAGRFFGDRHRNFSLELERFDVDWFDDGTPKQFVSHVKVYDAEGRYERSDRIVVNSPLNQDGLRVYQLSWGWAPHIRVTQGGKVLYDGPTVFLLRDGVWRGVVKLPQAKPAQAGLEMLFFANPRIDERGRPTDDGPRPKNPVVVFQMFSGDLRMDRPQSVYELDHTGLVPGETGAAPLRQGFDLPEGLRVEFVGLRQFSVFQVAWNPGVPLLVAGSVLLLVGLLPALYSSRRRIWVRAVPSDGAARLEIAGHALQRTGAFEEEFNALVRDLDRDFHARTGVPDG